MKKRICAAISALRGNKGSGLVLVLVCMLCVSILGIMILYLSYTGLLLKTTERQSKSDLYSASTIMDEVRAGVQKAASDSIADAYKEVLINYSNTSYLEANQTMEAKFQQEFKAKLLGWKSDGTNLFTAIQSCNYNADLLDAMAGDKNCVTSVSGSKVEVTDKSITLKGIRATYKDAKNYTTEVTSDIVVSVPDFSYIASNYSTAGLPSYALVAKTSAAVNQVNDKTVTGSMYAGTIDDSVGGLIIKNGTVVCRGAVTTGKGISTENVSLWANRISVSTKGNLNLSGSAYVQDDLDLAGSGASATLAGTYYGYGNDVSDPTKSSSILVNGRDSTLNLAGLNRLMLAGHSFVSNSGLITGEGIDQADAMMGESVTVKGNQMAYLIPADCLDGVASNPYIYSADSPNVTVKTYAAINGIRLSDYSVTPQTIQLNYPGTDQKIAYFFMKFGNTNGKTSVQNANDFFKAYFTANSGKIQQYVKGYLSSYTPVSLTQSAGWTLTKNGDNYTLGSAPINTVGSSSAQLATTFANLCQTLSAKSAAADSPYEYYVNTGKVAALTAAKYFTATDEKKVGVVVNGGYTIDDSDEQSALNVVIASGDVIVNRAFSGLIISGGTVTINYDITADSTAVNSAFAATNGTETLGSYLQNGVGNTSQTSDSGSSWNYDKLVTYQNWSKN